MFFINDGPKKKEGMGVKRKEKTEGNELEEFLRKSLPVIKVVGTGGAGNNTVTRLSEMGIYGAETIAMNTDAQQLVYARADKKVLLGKESCRGLGAGSNPEVGEAAARESTEEIAEALADSDLVFITCGLGGGTGTGSAPVIAEVARDLGALTVAVVTLPFTSEGKQRMENAFKGLSKLKKAVDTIIIIPNDKLLELVPDLPLNAAFKVADEVLANAIKGITEAVTKPGLINIDFADLRTVLQKGGPAMIGLGESSSDQDRALEAAENALSSPLLDIDISEARRALVNVIGGQDMTLKEAETVAEAVATRIHHDSLIIWGAMVDENVPRNVIKALVVVVGGKIPYLEEIGGGKLELDLDYVE